MARPRRKGSAWPYVAKSGRKSYAVGFYDHEKTERSRSFPTVRHARAWMDDYITAERRGRESLRRFLLDLDAKEANAAETRTIAAVLELYLAVNAHPRNEGGLAPSTYERYEQVVGLHLLGKVRGRPQGGTRRAPEYALKVASVPAAHFNEPQAPRAWREDMLIAGVPKPTRDKAWSVLSAALSWAAASQMVPEIKTNGCGLANEQRVNRRRSMRRGGTGYAPVGRRRGLGVASWALSPQAVEAVRAQMLLRVHSRGEILAQRDAMVVSLQYGLCARNQEVWGLRWASLAGEFAWVREVLSCGQLEEWGKTEHSTERRTAIPSLLQEDLSGWRVALGPYALRRGGISLRLRAEDPQTVASECGTSLKMLSDHYAYAIEDLRRQGPRPADVEWRAARAAQIDRQSYEPQAMPDHERASHQRKSVAAWFAARRRGPGA
jgi:hypothetical protein